MEVTGQSGITQPDMITNGAPTSTARLTEPNSAYQNVSEAQQPVDYSNPPPTHMIIPMQAVIQSTSTVNTINNSNPAQFIMAMDSQSSEMSESQQNLNPIFDAQTALQQGQIQSPPTSLIQLVNIQQFNSLNSAQISQQQMGLYQMYQGFINSDLNSEHIPRRQYRISLTDLINN